DAHRDKRTQLRYRGTRASAFSLGENKIMTDRVWYFAVGGNRQGPISDDQMRAGIAGGQIRADTLVWHSGLSDWTKAGDIPGLIGPGAPPSPVPRAAPPELVDGGQEGMPLATTVGTWGLFGRVILIVIGTFLIVPAPWVMTWFYRWFIPQIDLPNG